MGGRSRRFGSDKALASVASDGTRLGDVAVRALRGAGVDPVVAIGGQSGHLLGLPTITDRWPGQGPLAGLATALLWARTGHVLVVPCDLPWLDHTDVAPLVEVALVDSQQAVVATVDGQPDVQLVAVPATWGVPIRSLVEQGERAYRSLLTVGPWVGCPVRIEALLDADIPEDLAPPR